MENLNLKIVHNFPKNCKNIIFLKGSFLKDKADFKIIFFR